MRRASNRPSSRENSKSRQRKQRCLSLASHLLSHYCLAHRTLHHLQGRNARLFSPRIHAARKCKGRRRMRFPCNVSPVNSDGRGTAKFEFLRGLCVSHSHLIDFGPNAFCPQDSSEKFHGWSMMRAIRHIEHFNFHELTSKILSSLSPSSGQ